MLLKKFKNGGLHYVYDCCNLDPALGLTIDRETSAGWLLYKSPLFIRAFEYLYHYIRIENTRVLLAVNTPWKQNYIVSTLAFFGDGVVIICKEDSSADRAAIQVLGLVIGMHIVWRWHRVNKNKFVSFLGQVLAWSVNGATFTDSPIYTLE
ncbi:hypothetical protein EDB82DRAFT_197271 [Fusarium venenatum]|uniref:uncharacterized protein n=1 Tax=Fusarium venenatum TaxID=56646 RepID=UPI001DC4AAC1|nr:hypothetical protein EDB82DRAFT_197271 [Fusarium venenatum]